jgi:hypothetical protein
VQNAHTVKTIIAVAALLISSCLTSWAWFPPSLTQEKINQIKVGVTTEADLVQLFGPPTTRHIDLRNRITDDWFRSVPMPWSGYLPFIGQLCGGLDLDAQELWVLLTPDGRVIKFEAHSSKASRQLEQEQVKLHRDGYTKER